MSLPKANSEYFQERSGVLVVAQTLNSMGLLWRETPNGDVGIDGQVEYVNEDGECTGHIIAAQIKSGRSYIRRSGDEILFYPSLKHVEYWTRFPLPVILFLHDPDSTTTYWIDARQWLRAGKGTTIRLPVSQTLGATGKRQLFETVAPLGLSLMPIDRLIQYLAKTVNGDPGFNVSFLDLFALGLTDTCRKVFFSMGLVMEIIEYRARRAGVGWTVGPSEHRFLDSYISWLVEQNIAGIDFADYLFDRDELQLAPVFVAPLTGRGVALVDALQHKTDGTGCIQETVIAIAEESRYYLALRMDQLSKLRDQLL